MSESIQCTLSRSHGLKLVVNVGEASSTSLVSDTVYPRAAGWKGHTTPGRHEAPGIFERVLLLARFECYPSRFLECNEIRACTCFAKRPSRNGRCPLLTVAFSLLNYRSKIIHAHLLYNVSCRCIFAFVSRHTSWRDTSFARL